LADSRFLISTHYTRYDWRLFALNFAALVCVLFPKLPSVSLVIPHAELGADATAPPTAFPALPVSDRSCTNSHAFQASNTSKDQVTLIRRCDNIIHDLLSAIMTVPSPALAYASVAASILASNSSSPFMGCASLLDDRV
jgi:hypothetical protein